MPPATKSIGYLKIAFTYAFKYLREYSQDMEDYFEYAIRSMLEKGGDTDTNAAIVGGLIGAVVGFTKIKKEWIHKLLNCEPKNGRETFLVPKYYLKNLLEYLYQNAPKDEKLTV